MIGSKVSTIEKEKAIDHSIQARVWYIKTKLSIDIDPSQYKAYLQEHPDRPSVDSLLLTKVDEIQRRATAINNKTPDTSGKFADLRSIPVWQETAPKAELKVSMSGATRDNGSGPDAPYPDKFADIIEAVTTGKPMPGVREIPNTVIRQPVSHPICTSFFGFLLSALTRT
jgi:hypothetical protein